MISNACGSLAASPQIWRSACWLIKFTSPSRTSGWSSTSSTLIVCDMIFFSRYAVERQRASDTCATQGRQAFDVKGCTHHAGAEGHDAQSQPVAISGVFRQSNAVVNDGQNNFMICGIKADVDVSGFAVPDRIVNVLLRDPIQMRGNIHVIHVR